LGNVWHLEGTLEGTARRLRAAKCRVLSVEHRRSDVYERRTGRWMSPPSGTGRVLFRIRASSKPVLFGNRRCIAMPAKIEPAIGIYQAAIQFETLIAIASRCARIE